MHKLNPRTAALLSAFGWAVGYLLAGKALAALLPAAPGGAARFFRVCLLAPLAEEGVFRARCSAGRSRWAGNRPFFCRRCCLPCSTAASPPWSMHWCAGWVWGGWQTAPDISGRGCCCTVQTICWCWRWDERMGYMTDFELMGLALEEAAKAAALGEVPVGAVVARHGEVVATAHNTRETEKNALHHAELLAIDAACKALGGWRLWECELFVTLEPCPMCAGGIINSRLRRVVYGAADTKAGCCGSVTDLFALPFNHHPVVEKGLREAEAQQLLQAFFVSLREKRAGRPRWKPPVPENRGK